MEKLVIAGFDLGPYIFAFLGLVATIGGIVYLVSVIQKLRKWTRVTGRITGYEKEVSDRKTVYRPVYTFKVNGAEQQGVSGLGFSHRDPLGQVAIIFYNPDRPTEILVFNVFTILQYTLIWLIPGLIFIWMSVRLFMG